MKTINLLIILVALCFVVPLSAQQDDTKRMVIDGHVVRVLIQGEDTLLVATLKDVPVSSPSHFESQAEYRHYLRMKRYAASIYPYAVEAIKVFRDIEAHTVGMKKRHRKKHIRRLQKELKQKFEDPLKNLTRTGGTVLLEMIERELDQPTYEILKEVKGGFNASYWNSVGKLFGYDLKEGYDPEADPILEIVLSMYDVSHTPEPLPKDLLETK